MTGKPNHLLAFLSAVLLIGLSTSTHLSLAGEHEDNDHEHSLPATIAVHASVIRVELEALEDFIVEGGLKSLRTIPVKKLWHAVREREHAEIVSGNQLLVREGGVGELSVEESEQHKHKHEQTVETHFHELQVFMEAKAELAPNDQIAVAFSFKQLLVEDRSEGAGEAEGEERIEVKLEVSTELVLPASKPTIVNVKSAGDTAMFLILTVDH